MYLDATNNLQWKNFAGTIRVRTMDDEVGSIFLRFHDAIGKKSSFISPDKPFENIILMEFLNPAIWIDGLDESRFLYSTSQQADVRPLQKFLDTVTSPEVVSLIIGGHVKLYASFPKVGTLKVRSDFRRDKIPVFVLAWTFPQIVNYADFKLDKMRALQSKPCKSLPAFRGLVPYETSEIKTMLSDIKTPRELHDFMNKLFVQMNSDALTSANPYIATKANIEVSLKQMLANRSKQP
jgi:hypothetical protein